MTTLSYGLTDSNQLKLKFLLAPLILGELIAKDLDANNHALLIDGALKKEDKFMETFVLSAAHMKRLKTKDAFLIASLMKFLLKESVSVLLVI